MKKFKIYLILLSLFLLANLQAQSQKVIATSGKQYSDEKIDVCWTIGEPVSFITEVPDLVTQGFHQPLLTVSGFIKKPAITASIEAFPNPTFEFLNLIIKDKTSLYRVEIFNGEGEKIFSEEMPLGNDPQTLDFTAYAQGAYFVRVSTRQTNFQESFKVIKN